MDIIGRSVLHHINPKYYLVSSYAYLVSFDINEMFINSLLYIICSGLFPIAMGIALPVFMHLVVLEKSTRVKSIMQMHGLKEVHYWLVNMFSSYLLYLAIYGSFYFVGRYILELSVFIGTGAGFFHTVNLLWGFNQIGMAIILQMVITSPRTANIIGYTGSVTVQFICLYLSLLIYNSPFYLPFWTLWIPQMSYARLYFYISKQCLETKCFQSLSQLEGEVATVFKVFVATAIIYPIIGVILNYMNFHSMFPWQRSERLKDVKRVFRTKDVSEIQETDSSFSNETVISGELKSDVEREKEKAAKNRNFDQYPIVIDGVSKWYMKGDGPFQALKPTGLCVAKGEVLGLLGPNGAGKTTLISILTGLIRPDSGTAWIGGCNILSELPNVYKTIGVCPQFDLFWEDLTIEEHLLFYLRLKGCSPESEQESVDKVCKDVELLEHKYKKARQLSGGMKRRLSLAIATIGEPQAIFLDEPTTGLDPLNREKFWAILERIKHDKSIILTTHLMQEADYLSDRIGKSTITIAIINNGMLQCVGTPTEIKQSRGNGLVLSIIFEKEGGLFTEEDRMNCITGIEEMLNFMKSEGIVESFSHVDTHKSTHTAKIRVIYL